MSYEDKLEIETFSHIRFYYELKETPSNGILITSKGSTCNNDRAVHRSKEQNFAIMTDERKPRSIFLFLSKKSKYSITLEPLCAKLDEVNMGAPVTAK